MVGNLHKNPKHGAGTDNDAERFLDALQNRVSDLRALSELPKNDPETINFEHYHKFRNMMSECLSFSIIIERRIEENQTAKKINSAATTLLLYLAHLSGAYLFSTAALYPNNQIFCFHYRSFILILLL